VGFQLDDISRSNAYVQSANVSKTRDCVDVRTMSFDVVNVNDEVLWIC
jgi:hypothetical protein